MRNKQQGAFAIEMAFVMFFLAALLFFTGDLAYKLFNRVNLDRASYSLVNVVKERTRFYNKQFELNQKDLNELQTIATRLLNGHNQFGLRIESWIDGKIQVFNHTVGSSPTCLDFDSFNQSKRSELVPVHLTGEPFPLYQVTLCYKIDNWFNKFLVGNHKNKKQSYLHSTSVLVGR